MRRKVTTETLRQFMKELALRFSRILPGLLRYPAIDPRQFKKKVEDFLAKVQSHGP